MTGQSMRIITAATKRRTGRSNAQAGVVVWTVPKHLLGHRDRLVVSAQEKVGVRHRRPPAGACAQRAGIEPLRTTKVLQRDVWMSEPYVNPAATYPCRGKIGVEFHGPVDQLFRRRQVTQDKGHRPRSSGKGLIILLADPHNDPPQPCDLYSLLFDVLD